MFSLLSQRNFSLLCTAHTISILGDYVFFIAITYWIYAQTGSAIATGTVLIVSTVPAVLFGPLAGIIADRLNRKSIMLVAESARAALFLGLLAALVIQPQTIWPIYVVRFLQSALASFFWTARSALLPQMIDPPALLAANALFMMSDSGIRIIAPSLSALALLHLGPPGVVTIDAATFVISAGGVYLLALAPQDEGNASASLKARPSLLPQENDLQPRFEESTTQDKQVTPIYADDPMRRRGIYVLGSIITYTAGTLSILFPIFVRTLLVAGPLAYGWLLTAQALGEGAMSLYLERTHTRRGFRRIAGFVSICFAIGGGTLGMLILPTHMLLTSLLFNLAFGAMTAGATIQLLTFLQQRVANRMLGRTLATYSTLQAFAQVGGLGIASVVAAHIGVVWPLVFDSILYVLGCALAWMLLKEDNDPRFT